jgi:hypothetical protein
MPGLDQAVIDQIDHELALNRILTDVKSDFIIAPHYSAVYANVGDLLWDQVRQSLRSGKFEPNLPITIEVPKPSGLTRPGSILSPADRLVYQALIDTIAPFAEQELDRDRVFSNVLLNPDPEFKMFEPSNESWEGLKQSIVGYCRDGSFTHAIKADVASFFERLYQHNLINLLRACSCSAEAVNLLEKLLLAWMEKDSHGILQGMFPSDFLGNFYLFGIDADMQVRDVPSSRYVDDMYIFYHSKDDARKGLVELCRMLRHEGLNLNEKKSGIVETDKLLIEETQLDRMFVEARAEIESEIREELIIDWYGFQPIWAPDIEEPSEEEIELKALIALYEQVDQVEDQVADKIEKFCLPFLSVTRSDIAVDRSLRRITERPHLAKMYSSYLGSLSRSNESISDELERLIDEGRVPYDWQLMWVTAALVKIEQISSDTVNGLFRIMRDTSRSIALRGLCPLIIGKHGNPGQRRNLRHHYPDEPSEYVRSSILFSTRFFPTPERKSCIGAWSGHSVINAWIAEAVKQLVR